MTQFSCEIYNDNSFVVRAQDGGKTHPLHKDLVALQGRWNPRLTGGPGWTVPLYNENKLKQLIGDKLGAPTQQQPENDDDDQDEEQHVPDNIKSRKDQSKYHRAVSESESEDPVVDAEPVQPSNMNKALEQYCAKFTKNSEIDSEAEDDEEEETVLVVDKPPRQTREEEQVEKPKKSKKHKKKKKHNSPYPMSSYAQPLPLYYPNTAAIEKQLHDQRKEIKKLKKEIKMLSRK